MTRFKKFVLNGLQITVVSLLIRSVSVSFNVYLSNKIGAVAMGLFTLISTVYGFAITIATSGIGLATTKLISESLGSDPEENPDAHQTATMRCIMRKAILYSLTFSVFSMVALFYLAPWLGESILQDARCTRPLRVLAFTLPPIAISSALNGYFVAVRRVVKNAVVQIIGQALKIYACIALIAFLGAEDVESACLAVVLGGAIAEILSFLLHAVLYFFEKRQSRQQPARPSSQNIQKNLLRISLPVAFSAYVRSGLVTIEHMLIPWGLERSGSSRDLSLAAYGIVHSMAFPLVLFPSAISSSFASLLIPEISESLAKNDHARIDRMIEKVFLTVLIFAIGTAGILMCFSYELAEDIYPGNQAGRYILMIAPLVPVMYMDTAVDSLLKGLGEQFYCMVVNIVDAAMSVILVWLLLPRLGIIGYILTVYFTEIVNATLSITRLLYVSKVKPRLWSWVGKPLISVLIATAVVRILLRKTIGDIPSLFALIVNIALTALIYVLLLIIFREHNQKQQKSGRNT